MIACNQDSASNKSSSQSVFEQETKTPLEEQVDKVYNTVLLEPMRSFENSPYFYNVKQNLFAALENSTQKESFFSCEEFKKSLKMLIQTDYSSDFPSETWQRKEIENIAQQIAKEQCGEIYLLRANLLADLQYAVNSSDTEEELNQNAKPIIEDYSKAVLEKSEKYTNSLNEVLAPYKKLRQIFYPLDQAGYKTYILEQNGFKKLKKVVTNYLQGRTKTIAENKTEPILKQAQEDEKVLFVFLKKYETLTQTNGECIKKFFPGLQDKWYDFMFEIEKLPSDERQDYADKRFNQANDGLKTKCVDLMKKTKKQNQTEQQSQETVNQQEEDEEVYYF